MNLLSGCAIANGMPGKPAPVPKSSTSDSSIYLEIDRLSCMCFVKISLVSEIDVKFHDLYALTVVLAAEGYPAKPIKVRRIIGLPESDSSDCWVNHAGTGVDNEGEIISTGGRVLSCSATGDSVYEAAFKAYQMMDSISLEGSHFRKDIGYRAL